MIGIISLLTFFSVFLGIFTVNFVIADLMRQQKHDMLEEIELELHRRLRVRAQESVSESESGQIAIAQPMIQPQDQHFSLVEWWKRWNNILGQSGLEIKQQTLMLISILGGVAAMVILGSLTWNIFIALLGACLVCPLPFLYVLHQRNQRLEVLREQLPDALDMMSRLLKAGQSASQAIQVVAEELQPPVSYEFEFCHEQQRLGLSQSDTLHELARRTGLVEIKIFVLGVLINQQSGGNLSELLDKLTKIIRQRFQMKGQIKALTAEGRLQAAILLVLPFAIWLGLLLVNRVYALKLLEHPTLIIITIVAMLLGALWIRKIVNFDF